MKNREQQKEEEEEENDVNQDCSVASVFFSVIHQYRGLIKGSRHIG